ncbi:MAG: glycosyl transferase family 2 [Solirubrobacterales bacterium]|nr:glycosyl transferase family 2 [Solirubrobacterales bacterium]
MSVSVVIRCKDEAASIGSVLELLAAQTVAAQVIVVDSGSTDGTVEIVGGHAAELIEIPAASFTYGGALNTGTERATEEVVVALSAHSFPPDDRWLERMLDAMAGTGVACASGHTHDAGGRALTVRFAQDAAHAAAHPRWGYSSHAGAFRRSLWRTYGFRPDMPASEDKEWAWHFQQQGHVAVFGPDLMVAHSHGSDPLGEQFRRARNDWVGLGMFRAVEPPRLRELATDWWAPGASYDSALRARLSHKRLARLLGGYAGRRAASRRS